MRGVVQGVGFRPFVYTARRLVRAVRIRPERQFGAVVEVEGEQNDMGFLDRFVPTLLPWRSSSLSR